MPSMHDTNDPQRDWLTVPEVAARFEVNESTVRRWIYDGQFPGTIRTSPKKGDYRIPKAAVEQFEEQRKVG